MSWTDPIVFGRSWRFAPFFEATKAIPGWGIWGAKNPWKRHVFLSLADLGIQQIVVAQSSRENSAVQFCTERTVQDAWCWVFRPLWGHNRQKPCRFETSIVPSRLAVSWLCGRPSYSCCGSTSGKGWDNWLRLLCKTQWNFLWVLGEAKLLLLLSILQ